MDAFRGDLTNASANHTLWKQRSAVLFSPILSLIFIFITIEKTSYRKIVFMGSQYPNKLKSNLGRKSHAGGGKNLLNTTSQLYGRITTPVYELIMMAHQNTKRQSLLIYVLNTSAGLADRLTEKEGGLADWAVQPLDRL